MLPVLVIFVGSVCFLLTLMHRKGFELRTCERWGPEVRGYGEDQLFSIYPGARLCGVPVLGTGKRKMPFGFCLRRKYPFYVSKEKVTILVLKLQ